MDNNKLCIADTVNFSIYSFADSREDAELKLQKAIEANKKTLRRGKTIAKIILKLNPLRHI